MTMTRKIAAVGMGILALIMCLLPGVLAAEDGIAAVVMQTTANGFELVEEREMVPFWEAPGFTAGQSRSGGTLTLRNSTDSTVEIWLEEVGLPYNNKEALTYLNALRLVVKNGETVYYEGPYAKMVQAGKPPELRFVLAAQEEVTVTINVNCGFQQKGNKPAFQSIGWRFGGKVGESHVTMPPLPLDKKPFPWQIEIGRAHV